MCELAPVALNGERPAAELSPADVDQFLAGTYPEPNANVYGPLNEQQACESTDEHASQESVTQGIGCVPGRYSSANNKLLLDFDYLLRLLAS